MGALAIIPARGGSKRIPRKNIRDFLGAPIVAYSITAALESRCFESVLVSTDDEEIASIARSYGAEVPFLRSAQASNDHATTVTVLLEVLQTLASQGRRYDTACCLYPTAPFLSANKICDARDRFVSSGAKSLMSMVRFDYPIQRALTLQQGRVAFWMPEFRETRSQDLEPMFHDAGQMYWFDVTNCLTTGQLISPDCVGFELGDLEVQDIDTELDWALAELKFNLLKQSTNNSKEGKP